MRRPETTAKSGGVSVGAAPGCRVTIKEYLRLDKSRQTGGNVMNATSTPREALGLNEAADAIGIGRSSLYALLKEGAGPRTFSVGRRRLIRLETLRQWMRDQERAEAN